MYFLMEFHGIELPKTASRDDLTSGQTSSPTSPLNAGSLDLLAGERGRVQEEEISTEGAMCSEARLRTFRKLIGKRSRLKRWAIATQQYESVEATLLQITPTRMGVPGNARIKMTFKVFLPEWSNDDDVWYLDSGEFFDSGLSFDGQYEEETISASPHNFSIDNTESETPSGGFLTIVPESGGSIQNPLITNVTTGEWIKYTDTLIYDNYLILDLDGKGVWLDGVDAYNSFSANNLGLWMEIEDGIENNFTVTADSVTGDIKLYWSWARRYL